MGSAQVPQRYDFVGSFLRPAELKEARAARESGAITAEQLRETEDRSITDLVARQKAAGYKVITDGEFRRSTWHLDFMWGFEGIDHHATQTGLPFHDEAAMIDDTFVTGKIRLVGEHPFVGHFRFVDALAGEDAVAKQTMPSPAQMFAQFWMPFNRSATEPHYTSADELAGDIVAGYAAVLSQLFDAGCRVVQFDDCTWGMLADATGHLMYGTTPDGLPAIQRFHRDINNAAIAAAPDGMVVNTHVCRGNFHSTYANTGAYDPVADVLFGEENVNAYYLEFDDERSGGFEPLAKVSGDKKVVLGLVTTKSPVLEDKETVIARIHEAARYVPLERLCLSPQCGFASCEIGNKLTEGEQWAKLALVREIAEEVWGL